MADDEHVPAQGPVSVRDAIMAEAALRPRDETTRRAMLELLGLQHARPTDAPASSSTAASAPRQLTPPAPSPPPPAPPPLKKPPAERAAGPRPRPLAASLQRARTETARPGWLSEGSDVLGRAREAGPAPAPPPIFGPIEARGIYVAALASWVQEGELDVDAAIAELSAARPLRTIPRLPIRTLRRGAQLLLDRSSGMAPFAADVSGLADELAGIVSGAQLERLFFQHCPLRGVRSGLRGRRQPWRPPARGVPLFVVSDFGIAGDPLDEDRASIAEWSAFALELRADGHVCVGLVPFARARWPAALDGLITFVHWSERTVASEVDRTLRAALRRRA